MVMAVWFILRSCGRLDQSDLVALLHDHFVDLLLLVHCIGLLLLLQAASPELLAFPPSSNLILFLLPILILLSAVIEW